MDKNMKRRKETSLVEALKRLIEEGTWGKDFKLTPEEEAQFRKMRFVEEESEKENFTIGERVKRF